MWWLCDQKNWQSQRYLKGLGKVLLNLPKDLRSIAGPNWSRAVFWKCTKDWPRLIWMPGGFIGCLEVSKRSYVSRRSVSDSAAIGFTTKREGIFTVKRRPTCDWSAMRWWLIGALLPTSRRSVAKWFQSCTNHSAMGLQMSQTCQHMTASFHNKCLKSSDGTQKFEKKRPPCCPRSQPVLPSPSYQSSVHHHGNSCSILIYSLQAQQLQLSSC